MRDETREDIKREFRKPTSKDRKNNGQTTKITGKTMVNTNSNREILRLSNTNPTINGGTFRCYVRVYRSCTTSDTHRVTITQNHDLMCKMYTLINTNNIYNMSSIKPN